MFKREIRPLSEKMSEGIAKSINKLQYVDEATNRPADREEGDTKPQDISGSEVVKADGSATQAPKRKADKSGSEPMQKVAEEAEELDESKALIKDYQDMKAQGKKDSSIFDALMSMPKYKKMSRDQMAKVIGDSKRKGIFKEDIEITELHMALLEAHGIEKKVAEKVKKVFDAMSTEDKAAFMKSYLKNPKAATEYMFKGMQTMTKEEVELEEAMDPVDAKALKGKHSERKDKDIDNDGDVDKSDEYLHKRRQAITKALKKEEVDSSTGKKLEEMKLSTVTKKLKDGEWEAMHDVKAGKPLEVRDTKTGKRKTVMVENTEVELDEANKNIIPDEKLNKLIKSKTAVYWNDKGFNKLPNDKFFYIPILDKNKKMLGVYKASANDSDQEYEYLNSILKNLREEMELDEGYTINHKSFTSAVQHAKAQVEKQGYTIDDDEWDRKVAMGPKKPGTGKTNRYTIDLMKGGKETRRKLQMQVYYDEGRYELNMYIS